MTKLLTIGTGNPKIAKGLGKGYLTAILHLAPSRMSGYNVCPMATAGCSAACLNTAGRGGMFTGHVTKYMTGSELVNEITTGRLHSMIQDARIKKTELFFEARQTFMALLVKDIKSLIKRAEKKGLIPVVRLNGTSDIKWETVSVGDYANIMSMFPTLQFYDYTKLFNRINLPANYHLTFSLAETNASNAILAQINGMNVAVVFRNKHFPEMFNIDHNNLMSSDHKVINGDENDLRFLDPNGVIVGLKAKGKGKKDTSGFVREV